MKALPLLDLTRQARLLSRSFFSAGASVLESGRFVLGEEVSSFEKEFSRYCRAAHAVGVASGTDALELSLRALGVGQGDLVATVSFTFLATVDAILHVGAQPFLVDVDPITLTMDPRDLAQRLLRLTPRDRRRVRAVIPVHLFGHPCDMEGISKVARKFGLQVIEDCAQAAGARFHDRPVGGLGQAGCFSFFPTKNLGAFGDGGAVVTNASRIAQKLRLLRVHGRSMTGREVLLGRNSRLDELQAAFLRVKLRHLSQWVFRRRTIAAHYTKELSKIPQIQCPMEMPGSFHAYHLYVIRTQHRNELQKSLRRSGIAAQAYYAVPVHREPLHRGRFRGLRLPETERASRDVLALPLFPEMRPAEVSRVLRAIRRFFSR